MHLFFKCWNRTLRTLRPRTENEKEKKKINKTKKKKTFAGFLHLCLNTTHPKYHLSLNTPY